MLRTTTSLRVRYAETDQMRYVYYGNYPMYYEVGRAQLMREIGFSYRHMEEEVGVMMPVLDMNILYKGPGLYDEELTIEVTVKEMPTTRMRFDYRIFNEAKKCINEGHTTLAFVDRKSMRPVRIPEILKTALEPHFKS
jgi:acyl-CoA thioester hydrolase